jgi:uncharacterized protein
MLKKKIRFNNSNGQNLAAIIEFPENFQSNTIIIICHGFDGGKNGRINMRLSEELGKHNFVSLRFDFSGHCDSDGKIEDITISQGVDDLKSIIENMTEIIGVQKKDTRIGLIGFSYGAIVAYLLGGMYAKIASMVLLAPVFDYARVLKEKVGQDGINVWKKTGVTAIEGSHRVIHLKYGFLEDAEIIDADAYADKIKSCVMIIQSDADEKAPVEMSERIVQKIGKKAKLIVMKNAGHSFDKETDLIKITHETAKFFLGTLSVKQDLKINKEQ